MHGVEFNCANPQCGRLMSFDQRLVGTHQRCPYCQHELVVPPPVQRGLVPSYAPPGGPVRSQVPGGIDPYSAAPPMHAHPLPGSASAPVQVAASPWAPAAAVQQREMQTHTARKLNLGSGCLAMLAVIFGVGLVGFGLAVLLDLEDKRASGLILILAGLGGVLAFIFFGYIATETSSTSRGRDQR